MKTFFLFSVSLSAIFLTAPMMTQAADFEDTPKLVVRGEATLLKPADQMEVTLGVITFGKNAAEALSENKERVQRVIASIKALSLNESDYQTGRFFVKPIYEKNSKGESEKGHGKITQYEAINGVRIKTQKIALADKIIDAAVAAGANELDQVEFNLTDPEAYLEEVIKGAAQNALGSASVLAAAAGVKIKRVLVLTLDHWQKRPIGAMFSKNAEAGVETNREADVKMLGPGNTEIHATVNATFEIE